MRRWLLLVVTAFACSTGEQTDKARRVLATVNGTPVYLSALQRELKRMRLDDEEGGVPSIASNQAQVRALLDDLIERRLLSQEAEKHNVVVGTDEVENAYERTRAGWDPTEIEELLKEKDITPAELKRELRDLLTIQKYLRDHVYSRIAVTDDEISQYIDAHPEVLIVPEAVHAQQIVVKTEEKANAVLREIKSKTLTFEEAATKYSLSPEAKNSGDLGFFTRGSMPSVFDEVCFNLRPGEVSKVVDSDFGYHLFRVLEKRPEGVKPVLQVRDEIEQRLRSEKERDAHRFKVEQLKKVAKIDIKDKELARVQ